MKYLRIAVVWLLLGVGVAGLFVSAPLATFFAALTLLGVIEYGDWRIRRVTAKAQTAMNERRESFIRIVSVYLRVIRRTNGDAYADVVNEIRRHLQEDPALVEEILSRSVGEER